MLGALSSLEASVAFGLMGLYALALLLLLLFLYLDA